MPDTSPLWTNALRVAALLAADPQACGGVVVRAGAGPVRERWLDVFRAALPKDAPIRRMPTAIADDRLLGGLDLAATLRAGRPVAQSGLLAEADGGVIVVPMAERLSAGTVARLCAALDTGAVSLERDGMQGRQAARFGLILLDEGGEDEAVAEPLADRLAFRVDLFGVGLREIGEDFFAGLQASHPPPHPEVPKRSGGLEGGLQTARRKLEPFKAHDGSPADGLGASPPPCGEELEVGVVPPVATESSGTTSTLDPSPQGGGKWVEDPIATLCATAADLGIVSLRGPLLAARIARLTARLDGREGLMDADLIEAARLVLAPRATRMPASEPPGDAPDQEPEPEEAPPSESGEPPPAGDDEEDSGAPQANLDELILEAARAAIPPNLLAQLLAGGPKLRSAKAGRMGASSAAPRSGRPAGSRPGDPRRGRLDLIATLRAAAPWQRLRRGASSSSESNRPNLPPHPEAPKRSGGLEGGLQGSRGKLEASFEARLRLAPQDEGDGGTNRAVSRKVIVLPDDLRIKKLRQRTETTTIFCVDASGSAALERLAETKGAVELLLAESYVRRDRVALVAFRGTVAEVILPPTRSLARAKRVLGGLPGGGGTPLAAGIDTAATLALAIRRGGGSPVIVLLTDGRANVARSGEGGRARAGEEALAAGRLLKALGLPVLLIDTGTRPDGARRLADVADARYIPLPYADASGMSAAVRAAIA